jgi:hypothetical protein
VHLEGESQFTVTTSPPADERLPVPAFVRHRAATTSAPPALRERELLIIEHRLLFPSLLSVIF